MIVCGLDCSTTATGWAIFDDAKLITYGVIKPKSKDWRERIKQEWPELCEIMDKYKPEKLYIEDVPLKPGAKTLMKLGTVQGLILSLSAFKSISVEFLLPSEWRSDIGIYDGTREGTHRDVLKEKAVKTANKKFNIELEWHGATSKKSEDDIAEAILIAYSQVKPKLLGKKK